MIVRAKERAILTLHGKPHVIQRGDEYDIDSELVRAFPHAFAGDDVRVERATAAPGERRSVRVPNKK